MALTPALQKFTTASPVIASYNWQDMITGIGYLELKGTILETTFENYLGNTGILTSFNRKGPQPYNKFLHRVPANDIEMLELISPKFSYSKILEGTAYVSFTWAIASTSGSAAASQIRSIEIKLYKNDTLIASTSTDTLTKSSGGADSAGPKIELLPFEIPKTIINVDDTLTIKLISIYENDDSGTYYTYTYVAANVLDEEIIVNEGGGGEVTFPAGTTKFITYLPFKTDL